MKLLMYFGHPAQYLFLKNTIPQLRLKGHSVILAIKSKDVLESLLINESESYINLLPEGRKQSKLHILIGLLKRVIRLWRFARKKKIDLFIGSDPSLAHVGWILNIPTITVLEDDYNVIQLLAKTTYPFTNHILTPESVDVGKFSNKKIGYKGFMKLAYLDPNYFIPENVNLDKPYFLIRLSHLTAYHDFDIKGIDDSLIEQLLNILLKQGRVYISSEKPLKKKYSPYLLHINPAKIHHYLANASIFISDSQSMTVEAAMLGVPSIRFSDFVGRISVLEELEKIYGLTFGVHTDSPEMLLEKVQELIYTPNLRQVFISLRNKMLSDKIDVTAFLVWFIDNYSESATIMKTDSDYQDRFK